ncbi:Grx4 family monothiol glutaredoxin [Candidatus Lariskella endosymbiont of Hedychridium roseum]|uniref:Grx4 family monothiol glutaredoxin n=1 Tax=Candidatus Lariskella endosymbiont of Hedychridium roseum TaxID=3077949 RepID=UPI0030CFBC62
MSIHDYIRNEIESNDVVLFMKGSASQPACGFSSAVVRLLNKLNVKFKDIDVMTSSELREGVKTFANWPTIPQLYIKGQFIGGCDIVRQMYADGELLQLFRANGIEFSE